MSGATGKPRRRWFAVAALLLALGLVAAIAFVLLTPLRRTDFLQPTGARTLGEGGDPAVLLILAPWDRTDYCPGEFSVRGIETDTTVSISTIQRVSAVLPLRAGCAGVETVNGQIAVDLRLQDPLGTRTVVRADDGSPLPVLGP